MADEAEGTQDANQGVAGEEEVSSQANANGEAKSSGTRDTGQAGDEAMVTLPDGSQVSLKEAVSGYMRQEDYTKKTTAVAQQRKALGELADFGEFVAQDEKLAKKIEQVVREYQEEEDGSGDAGGKSVKSSKTEAQILKRLQLLETKQKVDDLQNWAKESGNLGRPLTKKEVQSTLNHALETGIYDFSAAYRDMTWRAMQTEAEKKARADAGKRGGTGQVSDVGGGASKEKAQPTPKTMDDVDALELAQIKALEKQENA